MSEVLDSPNGVTGDPGVPAMAEGSKRIILTRNQAEGLWHLAVGPQDPASGAFGLLDQQGRVDNAQSGVARAERRRDEYEGGMTGDMRVAFAQARLQAEQDVLNTMAGPDSMLAQLVRDNFAEHFGPLAVELSDYPSFQVDPEGGVRLAPPVSQRTAIEGEWA